MSMHKLTAQQLALIQSSMQQLRVTLATSAQHGSADAGFADAGARNLAAMMACIGAAQLMAATDKRLYSVFRMLCLEMAQGSPESVMMRKLTEMGPEMFGQDIAPPR
jgi:hypothetical protein